MEIYNIGDTGENMEFQSKLFDDEENPQKYHKSSSPGIDIPDMNDKGVKDSINFTENVLISSIKVNLDIDHTYRGDLLVTITGPSSSSVILHSRHQGGSDNNIKRTYDISSVPGLNIFLNQSMKGDWILHVQDLALLDKGVLNSWGLEFEGTENTIVELEESQGIRIPDNDPTGIELIPTTGETGQVKDVEVTIDITHSYIQDLLVFLISPAGLRIDLHNNVGGSTDNILKTYTVTNTPDLNTMLNQQISGDCKLHISDNASWDIGKLNRWYLKILKNNRSS
jgi:subtilisin-like proprotein convertase family protein